jgi:hypothetical protein
MTFSQNTLSLESSVFESFSIHASEDGHLTLIFCAKPASLTFDAVGRLFLQLKHSETALIFYDESGEEIDVYYLSQKPEIYLSKIHAKAKIGVDFHTCLANCREVCREFVSGRSLVSMTLFARTYLQTN